MPDISNPLPKETDNLINGTTLPGANPQPEKGKKTSERGAGASRSLCKSLTGKGLPCQRTATVSGFCAAHDPEIRARATARLKETCKARSKALRLPRKYTVKDVQRFQADVINMLAAGEIEKQMAYNLNQGVGNLIKLMSSKASRDALDKAREKVLDLGALTRRSIEERGVPAVSRARAPGHRVPSKKITPIISNPSSQAVSGGISVDPDVLRALGE